MHTGDLMAREIADEVLTWKSVLGDSVWASWNSHQH